MVHPAKAEWLGNLNCLMEKYFRFAGNIIVYETTRHIPSWRLNAMLLNFN